MLGWQRGKKRIFVRAIAFIMVHVFFFTNIAYAAPSDRSLFKNKRPNYKAIQERRETALEKRKDSLSGKRKIKTTPHKKDFTDRIKLSSLKDLSSIYIPDSLGRVIEVHQAFSESQATSHEPRLVVHIQDLHTNPEAQLNLANILEILIKDYDLALVCSEGAEGEVDTSSVSSFPDYEVRERVARLFIDSGELTGEEYLSITKYPDLPIWGIEDKHIYFKNIIEFNKIMKFSERSQVFIQNVKEALGKLKQKIYSKKLLEVDKKFEEYEENAIEPNEYIEYLLKVNSDIKAGGFKNIFLLRQTLEFEKTINQEKIIRQSQDLLKDLQTILSNRNKKQELDILLGKATLFRDQKVSPFSFYSYLDELARRYLNEDLNKYQGLFNFVDYLTKVNSLDSAKLFQEIEELTYELKDSISTNENQRLLTKSLRHIKFLEDFFNLKVSNEELDYYMANKEDFKVDFFKGLLKETFSIDFNPDLIDKNLPELEYFYDIAHKRDIAMVNNAVEKIEREDIKVAAFISGGFHTRGVTDLLKQKGYSYVVISPYSSTDIDEENYRNLLSGKRKPLSDLIDGLNERLRLPLGFSKKDPSVLSDEAVVLMIAEAIAKGKDVENIEYPAEVYRNPETDIIYIRYKAKYAFVRNDRTGLSNEGEFNTAKHKILDFKSEIKVAGLDLTAVGAMSLIESPNRKLMQAKDIFTNGGFLSEQKRQRFGKLLKEAIAVYRDIIKMHKDTEDGELGYDLKQAAENNIEIAELLKAKLGPLNIRSSRGKDEYRFIGGPLSETRSNYKYFLSSVFKIEVNNLNNKQIESLANAIARIREPSLRTRMQFFTESDISKILDQDMFDTQDFILRIKEEKKQYETLKDTKGQPLFSPNQIHTLLFTKLIPLSWIDTLMKDNLSKTNAIFITTKWANPIAMWEDVRHVRDRLISKEGLSNSNAVKLVIGRTDPEETWGRLKLIRNRLCDAGISESDATQIVLTWKNIEQKWEDLQSIYTNLRTSGLSKADAMHIMLGWKDPENKWIELQPIINELMKDKLSRSQAMRIVLKHSDPKNTWENTLKPIRDELMEDGLSKADATSLVLGWKDPKGKWKDVMSIRDELVEADISKTEAMRIVLGWKDPKGTWKYMLRPTRDELMEDGLSKTNATRLVTRHVNSHETWIEVLRPIRDRLIRDGLSKTEATRIVFSWSNPKNTWENTLKLIRDELMESGLVKTEATRIVVTWSDPKNTWENTLKPIRDELMDDGLSSKNATAIVVAWKGPKDIWENTLRPIRDNLVENSGFSEYEATVIVTSYSDPEEKVKAVEDTIPLLVEILNKTEKQIRSYLIAYSYPRVISWLKDQDIQEDKIAEVLIHLRKYEEQYGRKKTVIAAVDDIQELHLEDPFPGPGAASRFEQANKYIIDARQLIREAFTEEVDSSKKLKEARMLIESANEIFNEIIENNKDDSGSTAYKAARGNKNIAKRLSGLIESEISDVDQRFTVRDSITTSAYKFYLSSRLMQDYNPKDIKKTVKWLVKHRNKLGDSSLSYLIEVFIVAGKLPEGVDTEDWQRLAGAYDFYLKSDLLQGYEPKTLKDTLAWLNSNREDLGGNSLGYLIQTLEIADRLPEEEDMQNWLRTATAYDFYLKSDLLQGYKPETLKETLVWLNSNRKDLGDNSLVYLIHALGIAGKLPKGINMGSWNFSAGAYDFYLKSDLLRQYKPENPRDTLMWLDENRAQLGGNSLAYLVQALGIAGRLPIGEGTQKWERLAGAYDFYLKTKFLQGYKPKTLKNTLAWLNNNRKDLENNSLSFLVQALGIAGRLPKGEKIRTWAHTAAAYDFYLKSDLLQGYKPETLKDTLVWLNSNREDLGDNSLAYLIQALWIADKLPKGVGLHTWAFSAGAYDFYLKSDLLQGYKPEDLKDTLVWLNSNREDLGGNSLGYLVQALGIADKLPEGASMQAWIFSAGAFDRAIKEEVVIREEIRRIWDDKLGEGYSTNSVRLKALFDPIRLPNLKTRKPLSPNYRNKILDFAYELYGEQLIREIKEGPMIIARDFEAPPFSSGGSFSISAHNFYLDNNLMQQYEPTDLKETIKWLVEHRDKLGNNSLSYLMQCFAVAGKLPEDANAENWQRSAGAYDFYLESQIMQQYKPINLAGTLKWINEHRGQLKNRTTAYLMQVFAAADQLPEGESIEEWQRSASAYDFYLKSELLQKYEPKDLTDTLRWLVAHQEDLEGNSLGYVIQAFIIAGRLPKKVNTQEWERSANAYAFYLKSDLLQGYKPETLKETLVWLNSNRKDLGDNSLGYLMRTLVIAGKLPEGANSTNWMFSASAYSFYLNSKVLQKYKPRTLEATLKWLDKHRSELKDNSLGYLMNALVIAGRLPRKANTQEWERSASAYEFYLKSEILQRYQPMNRMKTIRWLDERRDLLGGKSLSYLIFVLAVAGRLSEGTNLQGWTFSAGAFDRAKQDKEVIKKEIRDIWTSKRWEKENYGYSGRNLTRLRALFDPSLLRNRMTGEPLSEKYAHLILKFAYELYGEKQIIALSETRKASRHSTLILPETWGRYDHLPKIVLGWMAAFTEVFKSLNPGGYLWRHGRHQTKRQIIARRIGIISMWLGMVAAPFITYKILMSYPNIPAFEWAIGLFLPSMYLGSAIVHGIYNSLAIIFKFASLTIEDEKTPLNLDRKGLFEFEQGINEVLNMVRENPGKKILILINGNQRSGESRLIRNGALRQLTKEEKVGIIEEDQHEINFPIQNVHLKGMFEIITKQLASDSRVIIYDGINSFKIYSKLQYEILRSYDKELLVINLAVDKPQGFVKPEMYISVLGSSDASEVSHPREDLITISSTDRQEILKLKGFYNSLVQAKREKNWRKVKVLSSLIIRFVGRWNRNNPIDSTLYILGDSLTFIKEIDLANKANSVILCFSILEELEDYKLLEKSTDVLIKALSLTLFYLEEDTLPVKITDTPYGPRLMLDLDKMESLVKLGKFGTGKIGAPGSEKRKNFYMSLAHQVRKMSGNSGICKSISTLVVRKLLEEHGIDAVIMEKKMGEKGAHYYVQTIDGFIIDAFPLGHDYHLFERARVLGNQDIIVINKSTEIELEKNTIKEFYSSSKYQQYLTELARGKPMSSPAKDSTLPSLPGISYKKINLNMYPTDQEKYEHIYVYLADNVFKEQDMYKMKCFANIRMKYGTVIIAKDRLEVDALIKAGFTDNIVDIMVANEGHLSQFNIKDISSKIDVIIEAEKDDGRKVRLDMIEKLDSSLARSILSGV